MLLTKIHIPSPGTNLIHRSLLFDKLDDGLNRKLILVSAPAGFGKTTLISDWISQHKIPAAWVSLDKGDNDPVGFVSYIISGIQGIDKEFGLSALKLLKSSNKSSAESIIGLLINDILNINQNFLLVLDDFHLINNSEIQEMVSYLLENIPQKIHIVISTRSDPTLNLARLRSQNQLIELRSSELSFSTNDIYVLFNSKFKFGLSVQDISVLKAKTEGWIAGLQLAALSMQGYENKSGFIEAFAGNNRYIMDYLIEEVLKIQSDEIKDFLLKTSILKQISAPLSNAVLNKNDSQLILERLEKNNMFVFPLDEERNWYRYHHLFAELLKQRLLLTDKNTVEELHNRACEWFEHAKMYDLAIEHALEINNYNKSIQLLGEIVEGMWENGHHSAIMKYGDLLPEELIKKNPEFCLYYSWILIIAGQIQKAQPFLESAEKITVMNINDGNLTGEDIHYNKKRLGKISVAFAYLMSNTEHSDKIFDYCKIAMEYLSEDDSLWYSWGWFSYGLAYFSIGDLNESNKALWKALEHGKKAGNIYLISTIAMRLADNEQQLGHYKLAYKICYDHLTMMQESGYSRITTADWTYAGMYSMMAVTEHMWADLDRAHENIKIAYALSEKGKDVMLQASIAAVYSIVLQDRGDMDGAGKLINELEDILKQYKISPYMTLLLVAWKVIMFTRIGTN